MEADAEIHLDCKHLINAFFRKFHREKHKTNLIFNGHDIKKKKKPLNQKKNQINKPSLSRTKRKYEE